MSDKKDKFLVARIPSNLKNKIVESAKKRGISISKVVREILTRQFGD